mmetsp:Transcript_14055/g.37586  ORF Transcript_14055/g.37586 Transcript_14055/m.37586 type:complete len:157 (+) Transcript_14055:24-494(+)
MRLGGPGLGSVGRKRREVNPKLTTQKIIAFGSAGRWRAALKIFRDFPAKDVFTYTAAMTACCRCGRIGEAMEIFAEMKANGIRPTVVTYSALFGGAAYAREGWGVPVIPKLFEELKKDGFEASLKMLESAVYTFAKAGEDEKILFRRGLGRFAGMF